MQGVKTFVIDLFCGAGGTSTGIFYADTNIEVVACINHDKNAILSHAMNYPNCLHFTEDIRTVELSPLKAHIDELRAKNPGCKIAIWASLECTNFSKAKCGPKDCDSRTLAEHIFRYLDVFEPEFLWIENVEEFRLWGPLDENGNPIKELEGHSYREWVNTLTTKYFGPEYYDKTLSSDDFGGMTIRKRLFLQFAKDGRMIGDPKPTHGKGLKPVVPVKEALNLELEGKSILNRARPLVPKSMRRIYKGLNKFGRDVFGVKYFGQLGFQSMDKPCATLTTKDRIAITKPIYIKQDYGASLGRSLEAPAPAITGNCKEYVVSASFITNPQYQGSNRSLLEPAPTIIARQDKAPIGVVNTIHSRGSQVFRIRRVNCDSYQHVETKGNEVIINILPKDCNWTIQVKKYMWKNELIDVQQRWLEPEEMLKIQGFPDGYKLVGTKTEKKKFIGNSVERYVCQALIRSIDEKIQACVSELEPCI